MSHPNPNPTYPAVAACGIHGHPTHPGTRSPYNRCSACDGLLPYWHELLDRPDQAEAQDSNLRIDTGDFRLWTARGGIEDGHPYEHTVYVEFLRTPDEPREQGPHGWCSLGEYDGEEPPRSLPGLTLHALRGEVAR